ncbi:unnamed protein product, partial [Effrenium voratum]
VDLLGPSGVQDAIPALRHVARQERRPQHDAHAPRNAGGGRTGCPHRCRRGVGHFSGADLDRSTAKGNSLDFV